MKNCGNSLFINLNGADDDDRQNNDMMVYYFGQLQKNIRLKIWKQTD